MEKRTGKFICTSVTGANHTDKGIACQDAATCATLYHKSYLFYFMAVADGHGGAAYTRSDIGSFLALQAASESVNRFIISVIDAFEKYPDDWVKTVKDDFLGRFAKTLVDCWMRMVAAHAKETNEITDETIKLYGTTVSVAFVFNNYLFSGRIGDSSVFTIDKQNKKMEVKNLFETYEAENTSLGLSTASLCSRDAYRKWQIQALPLDGIEMLLLATDGFVDSLKDSKGEIADFYQYITKKGLNNFEKIIDKELIEITQKGVGDDISMVIFFPDQNRGGFFNG